MIKVILRTVLLLVLSTFLESTAPSVGSGPDQLLTPSTDDRKCWVFLHQQKSGGSTVRYLLKGRWEEKFTLFTQVKWRKGGEFIKHFWDDRGKWWVVAAGGYVAAFKNERYVKSTPSAGPVCPFFTLFRHPVSRIVSAYFYCLKNPWDQLCASHVARATDMDFMTFAKFWSNFGLRQFVLKFLPVDEVQAYVNSPEARALLPDTVSSLSDVPSWYLVKMYYDRHQDSDVANLVPDEHMHGLLGQVLDDISHSYAAVGVLEEWDKTLALFNVSLHIPGMDWQGQFDRTGVRNADNKWAEEEATTLRNAWTDPELKKILWLDLLLYEHAVGVFHEQLAFYGLL